jgi:hypothetical protein
MPRAKYFKGHGNEVMASIRKAHPGYSEKRVKAEFYATANKKNAKPGQSMTPKKKKKAKGGVAMKTLLEGPIRLDTY